MVDEYNRSNRIQSLAIALSICFAFFEINDLYKRGCVRDERIAFIQMVTVTDGISNKPYKSHMYQGADMMISQPYHSDTTSLTCTGYIELK